MIETPRYIDIPVVRVFQPIGDFYVGKISARDLVAIADFDVRRIQQEDGFESYLGIQREIDKKRVKEIREYVKGVDATFPTAVVLAVSDACAELREACPGNDQVFFLRLSNVTRDQVNSDDEVVLFRQIVRVIDGQHRIDGLRELGSESVFDVNISIFVGADIADQAAIFSTVNLAQTKVNKSLAYDLFDLANSRSPEKTAHNVVVALDRSPESPFHERIKRLGTATLGRFDETLSQATVVAGLLKYISGDHLQVLKDRQAGRRGGSFERLEDQIHTRLVLRRFFLEARDLELANLIWNYFEAVQLRWPDAWTGSGRDRMLNRTNGFNALIRFFRPAYLSVSTPGKVVAPGQFLPIFERVPLQDADFNPRRFLPGTTGSSALYRELLLHTGLG